MRLPFVLVLAACSSKSAPPPPAAGSAPTPINMHPMPPRQDVSKRSDLPRKIQSLVPKHGIYAAGGGLTSAAWRIIIDADAGTIYQGTAAKPNAPSYGPMDKETTTLLADADKQRLVQLAASARGEKASAAPPTPNADYDEILAVLDGDTAFFENGYGPIQQPIAAQLIADLKKTAAQP